MFSERHLDLFNHRMDLHRDIPCPEFVPAPERGGRPGPHRHGPGALLGPIGGLDFRVGRQLRHDGLRDLGHQFGPVQLRRQLPSGFQSHRRIAGFLHAGRNGPTRWASGSQTWKTPPRWSQQRT